MAYKIKVTGRHSGPGQTHTIKEKIAEKLRVQGINAHYRTNRHQREIIIDQDIDSKIKKICDELSNVNLKVEYEEIDKESEKEIKSLKKDVENLEARLTASEAHVKEITEKRDAWEKEASDWEKYANQVEDERDLVKKESKSKGIKFPNYEIEGINKIMLQGLQQTEMPRVEKLLENISKKITDSGYALDELGELIDTSQFPFEHTQEYADNIDSYQKALEIKERLKGTDTEMLDTSKLDLTISKFEKLRDEYETKKSSFDKISEIVNDEKIKLLLSIDQEEDKYLVTIHIPIDGDLKKQTEIKKTLREKIWDKVPEPGDKFSEVIEYLNTNVHILTELPKDIYPNLESVICYTDLVREALDGEPAITESLDLKLEIISVNIPYAQKVAAAPGIPPPEKKDKKSPGKKHDPSESYTKDQTRERLHLDMLNRLIGPRNRGEITVNRDGTYPIEQVEKLRDKWIEEGKIDPNKPYDPEKKVKEVKDELAGKTTKSTEKSSKKRVRTYEPNQVKEKLGIDNLRVLSGPRRSGEIEVYKVGKKSKYNADKVDDLYKKWASQGKIATESEKSNPPLKESKRLNGLKEHGKTTVEDGVKVTRLPEMMKAKKGANDLGYKNVEEFWKDASPYVKRLPDGLMSVTEYQTYVREHHKK